MKQILFLTSKELSQQTANSALAVYCIINEKITRVKG